MQQTEILKFVFVTYFRVLKTVGHSPLLSPVLEGLAKFAHLINVDFFSDLMAALQTLLNNKVYSELFRMYENASYFLLKIMNNSSS